tara:strand:- start:847 stop:1773 length:927 start_codon:yes stop_codon:yes gene_type:complete
MKYYLAPMMGYTDCYFRNLAENIYGNSIQTFSEMIVDKAIIYNETKTICRHFLDNNKSAIQIAGSDPKEIAEAIDILNNIDLISHVNFNLGCPSSRVQENKLGLALTQEPKLVEQCLESLSKYKKEISVKCRLGLGLEEDKKYIDSYLNLFSKIGIKTIFVHCRNGILDLDTKKNRTIPKINYNLFLECQKNHPNLNLIPNGEINNQETFEFLINKKISSFMIGRQFSKDILFIEKMGMHDLKNKQKSVLKFLSDINSHKFININLIKKSIYTLLNNLPNSKLVRKEISNIKNLDLLSSYFEEAKIWV